MFAPHPALILTVFGKPYAPAGGFPGGCFSGSSGILSDASSIRRSGSPFIISVKRATSDSSFLGSGFLGGGGLGGCSCSGGNGGGGIAPGIPAGPIGCLDVSVVT